MNESEILELAQNYMNSRKIDIVLPGQIGRRCGDKIEVIFLDPDTLDPDIIVCPPDNRVWVDTKNKEVTLIYQM